MPEAETLTVEEVKTEPTGVAVVAPETPTQKSSSAVPWQLRGHEFKPGVQNNQSGRGKGMRNWANRLDTAIGKEQRKHKRALLEHYVARAFKNDSTLRHLMERLLPAAKIDQYQDGEMMQLLAKSLVTALLQQTKGADAQLALAIQLRQQLPAPAIEEPHGSTTS